MLKHVQDIDVISPQLREAGSLPDLLAASFDAFEIVRMLARHWDHHAPELFAAFMMTADAAVDGREALTTAPALPAGPMPARAGTLAERSAAQEITAALAALGTLLARRLTEAARHAPPDDHDACTAAAVAARRIGDLMAGGDDDRRSR